MTPKQADFVRWYFELGNASEAYKRAYNSNAKPNTLHRKANDLLKHPTIKAEVTAMQEQARERNQVTIDNVVDELEEARQVAKQSGNASAMVSATLGKAKLLGLDKKAGVNENPMTAFIASIQGSSIKVVQQCDDDNYENED